jgi:hypothetical protein
MGTRRHLHYGVLATLDPQGMSTSCFFFEFSARRLWNAVSGLDHLNNQQQANTIWSHITQRALDLPHQTSSR